MAAPRTSNPITSQGPITSRDKASTRRTYVLDTSVLLADPNAVNRFHEHEVVIPVVVITELEGKRHHAELGFFARTALRHLDDLRIAHGRLDAPVPIGDATGIWRAMSHTTTSAPSRANARAWLRPCPLAPPVIRTT